MCALVNGIVFLIKLLDMPEDFNNSLENRIFLVNSENIIGGRFDPKNTLKNINAFIIQLKHQSLIR